MSGEPQLIGCYTRLPRDTLAKASLLTDTNQAAMESAMPRAWARGQRG